MRLKQLGRAGPEITTVGVGAWALGGQWEFGWGPADDDESVAAIRHAVDSGINWVDTAAVYGLGHSEEVVGKALAAYAPGEDVFIFTKCGLNWHEAKGEESLNNLKPESIRFECDQSLRRLGVERIDLFQFHWPDDVTGTRVEDSWGEMASLIERGKIRWAGVSNFDVDLLERCEAIRHVDSLQPPLSMLNRGAREEVIPWCESNGTGVIVYSPMASGLLTGKYDRERVEKMASDDWRRSASAFSEPLLAKNLELVERLKSIAGRLETDVPTLAVAWTLTVTGVTAAIVGARRPEQVRGWIGAGDLDLPPEVVAEIEAAILETGAAWE
jgi:aryl-alcohol dehydrogenase-like predicted oxidoreductase